MPPRVWHSLDSAPTSANPIEAANNIAVPARGEYPPPEDLRIDSGCEDDDGWLEISNEGRNRAAKEREPRRSSKKHSRDRKKQANKGTNKCKSLPNNKSKRALNEVPNITSDGMPAAVADNDAPMKLKITTTESRIDSGKEDSHCSSVASARSEDVVLIEVPNTGGTPIERGATCTSGRRKEDASKERATTPRRKKRALSTSKPASTAKKRRRASRVSTPKTPQRSQVPPTTKGKGENGLGESRGAPLSERGTPLDDGGGEDADKLEPKSTPRKTRSAKAPTALPVRYLTRLATAQPVECVTEPAGAAKKEEILPATIAECRMELSQLRNELRTTEEMLRLETSRAGELEEALELGIKHNGLNNSEHEDMVNSLADRDRELQQRQHEIAEKDEIIREKNAATRGYVEQIRELEQSHRGKLGMELERIKELEKVIAEREVTIRRLQTTAERYETGLKSVVKANRDLQKRVYSLNTAIRGAADE